MSEMPPILVTIARMRAAGRPEKEIAAATGLKTQQVSERARHWNKYHPENRILPAARLQRASRTEQAVAMYNNGATFAEIASETGLALSSAWSLISRARAAGRITIKRNAPKTAYDAYRSFRDMGAAPPIGSAGNLLRALPPEHARYLLDRMRTDETCLVQTLARIVREHIERA